MTLSVNLQNIHFSYTNKEIIHIDELNITNGEKVFIYGPSGCGKSTLLKLMTGILTPTMGEIGILGENLNLKSQNMRDQFRGEHIGFIFQTFNLIPYLTIKENIMLPLKVSKKRLQKIKVQVDQEIERITKQLGIFEYLPKRVSDLSIGQQQRVAVARALIGSPAIIIADEPTSSLDDDVTQDFMDLLLSEHEKKKFTLIFVSHDKRLARYFDKQINLSEVNKVGSLL